MIKDHGSQVLHSLWMFAHMEVANMEKYETELIFFRWEKKDTPDIDGGILF